MHPSGKLFLWHVSGADYKAVYFSQSTNVFFKRPLKREELKAFKSLKPVECKRRDGWLPWWDQNNNLDERIDRTYRQVYRRSIELTHQEGDRSIFDIDISQNILEKSYWPWTTKKTGWKGWCVHWKVSLGYTAFLDSYVTVVYRASDSAALTSFPLFSRILSVTVICSMKIHIMTDLVVWRVRVPFVEDLYKRYH